MMALKTIWILYSVFAMIKGQHNSPFFFNTIRHVPQRNPNLNCPTFRCINIPDRNCRHDQTIVVQGRTCPFCPINKCENPIPNINNNDNEIVSSNTQRTQKQKSAQESSSKSVKDGVFSQTQQKIKNQRSKSTVTSTSRSPNLSSHMSSSTSSSSSSHFVSKSGWNSIFEKQQNIKKNPSMVSKSKSLQLPSLSEVLDKSISNQKEQNNGLVKSSKIIPPVRNQPDAASLFPYTIFDSENNDRISNKNSIAGTSKNVLPQTKPFSSHVVRQTQSKHSEATGNAKRISSTSRPSNPNIILRLPESPTEKVKRLDTKHIPIQLSPELRKVQRKDRRVSQTSRPVSNTRQTGQPQTRQQTTGRQTIQKRISTLTHQGLQHNSHHPPINPTFQNAAFHRRGSANNVNTRSSNEMQRQQPQPTPTVRRQVQNNVFNIGNFRNMLPQLQTQFPPFFSTITGRQQNRSPIGNVPPPTQTIPLQILIAANRVANGARPQLQGTVTPRQRPNPNPSSSTTNPAIPAEVNRWVEQMAQAIHQQISRRQEGRQRSTTNNVQNVPQTSPVVNGNVPHVNSNRPNPVSGQPLDGNAWIANMVLPFQQQLGVPGPQQTPSRGIGSPIAIQGNVQTPVQTVDTRATPADINRWLESVLQPVHDQLLGAQNRGLQQQSPSSGIRPSQSIPQRNSNLGDNVPSIQSNNNAGIPADANRWLESMSLPILQEVLSRASSSQPQRQSPNFIPSGGSPVNPATNVNRSPAISTNTGNTPSQADRWFESMLTQVHQGVGA